MFLFLAALLSFTTHDLSRWHEATPPGAPFTLDVPLGLKDEGVRDVSGAKVHSWQSKYGFMTLEIEHTDRAVPTSFSPRQHLEFLGGSLLKDWPKATAKVTDVTIAGRPAAQLDMVRPTDSSTIHIRIMVMRIGDDDWGIQTTHIGDTEKADVAHVWASVQPPKAPPVLTTVSAGRLTLKAPGKAAVTEVPLEGEAAQTMEKWTVYAFEHEGKTKAWLYHLRFREGQAMNTDGIARQLVDDVIAQSNPKPDLYLRPQTIAGARAMLASGQAVTKDGDEAVRIWAIGDGRDGWALLAAGPNSARTEGILREMTASVAISR
jgi:hypothetical protein